jgi:ketosteroid isomerase-like protein
MRLESVELEIVGDIANEVGNATLSMVPTGGKNETAEVKFLVIWKRSDGKWRLHRDIWNTRSV